MMWKVEDTTDCNWRMGITTINKSDFDLTNKVEETLSFLQLQSYLYIRCILF